MSEKAKLENKRLQLLIDAGIKTGDWQYASKATLRALVGDPRTQLHVKLYLVGLMHTQGYAVTRRQKIHPEGLFEVELAIKLHRGRAVPLATWDLGDEIVETTREYYARAGRTLSDEEAEKARPSRQHIRRNLELLEDAGYALRATFEKVPRPLRSLPVSERQKKAGGGKLLLYFYVTPRPAAILPEVANFGYLDVDNLVETGVIPKDLAAIITKIQRIVGPVQLSLFARAIPDDLRDKFAAIAKAEQELKACKDAFKTAVVSYVSVESKATPPKPTRSQNLRLPLTISTNDDTNGAGRPAHGTHTPPQDATDGEAPAGSTPLVSSPRKARADLTLLAEGLRNASGWKGEPVDTSGRSLERLFGQCRDGAPDCTPEEVLDMCLERLAHYVGKPLLSSYGMLIAAVPPRFEGQAFEDWRRARRAPEKKPVQHPVAACSRCHGHGLIGAIFESIGQALAAVAAGATYCPCPEGALVRDLLEPVQMRKEAVSQ